MVFLWSLIGGRLNYSRRSFFSEAWRARCFYGNISSLIKKELTVISFYELKTLILLLNNAG
jgi:hypothetical protein